MAEFNRLQSSGSVLRNSLWVSPNRLTTPVSAGGRWLRCSPWLISPSCNWQVMHTWWLWLDSRTSSSRQGLGSIGIIAQGTGWNAGRGHSRHLAEVRLYQQEWLNLARGAGLSSHSPLGFYSSGNYCVSSPSNEREAMQKTVKGCPLGWTSSGSYCVKSR